MEKITVITADVIGSRAAGMRADYLSSTLAGFSSPALLVPFSVSRGDELQGIMAGWLPFPQLVRKLRWHCRPLGLRIGIGIGYFQGELGTDPWKLNGPAFFRARQALEAIGASKEPATQVVTGQSALDALVNSAWLLLDTVVSRWTGGQWEAVMAYEEAGTMAAAADVLGVATQNVQKRCKAAHWNQVRQAEQGLGKLEELARSLHPEQGECSGVTQKTVKGEDQ